MYGFSTIRYDTRCYFNVRSKADIREKTDMLRSIGKQSEESVESVQEKKW